MKMLAFALTTAIAVPLDADIQSDGPQLRPKQQSLELLDGTLVTLDLDRGVMPAGGKASVTLVATSDHAHKVTVALRALEDMGYGAERVQNPPKEVEARTVTLEAQPGGGPPKVETFQLDDTRKLGRYEWFDIVASTKYAAASVGVATWTGNIFAMKIEPPAAIPAEGAFSLAVRIKNTTKKPLSMPDIRLGAKIGGVDGLDSQLIINDADYAIERIEDPAGSRDNSGDDAKLAPGAEYLALYRVNPHVGLEHFTFIAHASSWDENNHGAALATLVVDRPHSEEEPAGALATK
jgi:hypothetical protein